jgi:hypothetical protein
MIGFIATYTFTTRDYRHYSSIAVLHTFQFTVTHALGFSVFTSRILATDISLSLQTTHEVFLSPPNSFRAISSQSLWTAQNSTHFMTTTTTTVKWPCLSHSRVSHGFSSYHALPSARCNLCAYLPLKFLLSTPRTLTESVEGQPPAARVTQVSCSTPDESFPQLLITSVAWSTTGGRIMRPVTIQ